MTQQGPSKSGLPFLTLEEYNNAESMAVLDTPNVAMEAFHYALADQKGYPNRINNESELWKYVDVNGELSFERNFLSLLGGITPEEFQLLKTLTTRISEFSGPKFGKKLIARGSILSGLNILRHIKYIYNDDHPRVFEIGPGAGSLGSILQSNGYPYGSTDVSQGFYLYQNQIWNHSTGGNVRDLAKPDMNGEGWSAPQPGHAVHGPWWRFINIRNETAPKYDLITCSEVLREMHLTCLSLSLKTVGRFLENDESKKKLFMFRGWGGGYQTSDGVVAEHFYRLGYVLVHHDEYISVLAHKNSQWSADHLVLPAKQSRLGEKAKHMMRRLAGAPPLPRSSSYQPTMHTSMSNPISRAILQGREAEKASKTIKIEEVTSFHTEVLGTEDHLNADERFMNDARLEISRTPSRSLQ